MVPPSKKRQGHDVQFKKAVLKWYFDCNKRSLKDAADHFELKLNTVKTFYRNREAIMSSDTTQKRLREAEFPELEADVIDFINVARSLRLPVTGNVIQIKARSIRAKHGVAEDAFSASKGWLHRFIRRAGIGESILLYGTAGEVDKEKVRDQMIALSSKLAKFKPEHIYNEDETGFFYQSLPNITYLAPSESKKEARGTKNMRSKERITVAVCTNADGSHVIPPFFIGRAKYPKCFALSTSADKIDGYYKHNRTSWMVGEYFNYFLEKIWYPEVRKRTSSNVCILLDNCAAHGDALPNLSGVEYLFLPPNVTSVYQPLDMGLLQAIKVNDRRSMLLKLIKNVEKYNELHALGKMQKPGMKGLDYCHPAHVLDAIRAIRYSFSVLNSKQVAKCWIKAGILMSEQVHYICDAHGVKFPENYDTTPGFAVSDTNSHGETEIVVARENFDWYSTECVDIATYNEVLEALKGSECNESEQNVEQEISNWLSNLALEETNRTRAVDKEPEQFVSYIDYVQKEQAKEAAEYEELKKRQEVEAMINTDLEKERVSYAKLLENYEWLEKCVQEGTTKNLDEEVHGKLVETLRVAKQKMLAAAPKKKQKCIGDFFSQT